MATPPTGRPRGRPKGPFSKPRRTGRPAGRPKGAISKSTRAIIEAQQANGVMPLEVMLYNMRRHFKAKRYDQAALFAEKAAPYLHARLASSTITVRRLSDMDEKELTALADEADELLAAAKNFPGSAGGNSPTKH